MDPSPKIMTAIIAIEDQKPDDKYSVTKDDIVGQDSKWVSVPVKFTIFRICCTACSTIR